MTIVILSHVVWQSVNQTQATLQMTSQSVTQKRFVKINLNGYLEIYSIKCKSYP